MPKRSTTNTRLDEVIGSRIKEARRKKGWTQAQVSVALRVQSEAVSRYETGSVPVSLAQLFKIAAVLGVGVHELLNIPATQLAVEEVALVNEWRLLDERGRRLLMEMLRWGRRLRSIARKREPEGR